MEYLNLILKYYKYIIAGCSLACFLVVNIIQAIRSHDISKLKKALCRVPEIIRTVETLTKQMLNESNFTSTTAAAFKSSYKKATAETLLMTEFGEKFYKKHKQEFDDAIEDVLNTPQKKGGSNDGISKENEER